MLDASQGCGMLHTPEAERTWNSYCGVPLQLALALQCTVVPAGCGPATSGVSAGAPHPLSVKGRS